MPEVGLANADELAEFSTATTGPSPENRNSQAGSPPTHHRREGMDVAPPSHLNSAGRFSTRHGRCPGRSGSRLAASVANCRPHAASLPRIAPPRNQ
jgi:hypothetical protein